MEIITARNVIAYAHQPDSLDMEVLFSHLPGQYIDFTARKDDSALHGRQLYVRAMRGDFGTIAQLDAPLPSEGAQMERLAIKQQQAAMAMAPLEDANKLGIISPQEQELLTAWQRYRVELYRLPSSEGWPGDVTWPEAPAQR